MASRTLSFSPDVYIYLKVGEFLTRLADVLGNTATVYERVEYPPDTDATIIYSINGIEDREEIHLHSGVSKSDEIIEFTYR